MIISDLNLLQAVDGAGVVGGDDSESFTGTAVIAINPTINGQTLTNNALAFSEASAEGRKPTTVTFTTTSTGNGYAISRSGSYSGANQNRFRRPRFHR